MSAATKSVHLIIPKTDWDGLRVTTPKRLIAKSVKCSKEDGDKGGGERTKQQRRTLQAQAGAGANIIPKSVKHRGLTFNSVNTGGSVSL